MRPGCLVGVDKKLTEKEERTRQRKIKEEKKCQEQVWYGSFSSSLTTQDFTQTQENDDLPTSLMIALRDPCHPRLKW